MILRDYFDIDGAVFFDGNLMNEFIYVNLVADQSAEALAKEGCG